MRDSKNIRILVVEDDPIQANILMDKLLERYNESQIQQFLSGEALKEYLQNHKKNSHYYYLILDYFLQTEENANGLNGLEIIEYLQDIQSDIRIVLFSAYENDDNLVFNALPNEHENIIGVIKKTDFGFVALQNMIRFDYNKIMLKIKHKRFVLARSIFFVSVALSALFLLALFLFY